MAVKRLANEADGTLGGLIRWKRQRLEMRVIDLAEKTGLSPGYISKMELNRATNPSDTILYRLATALKLDPVELKSRTKTKTPGKSENGLNSVGNGKDRRHAVSVSAINPLRHDAIGVQLHLKSEERFTAAYERLAAAYDDLGLLYCTTTQEDGSLDYRSAFAAYDASASIYERTGLITQLLKTRYRIARTYQNLIVTDRVKPDERLIFLQRAQELLNQVFSADMPAQPNGRQSFLKPASQAVGAAINKLIAHEIRDEIGRTPSSEDKQQALEAEVDAYVRAGRLRRLQADGLYAEIVRNLDAHLEQPLGEEEKFQAQEEAAYAIFLMAVNKRALETDKEDEANRDMGPSIALFLEALRRQRDRSKGVQRPIGSEGFLQAAHRLQLARFHQELGIAYSYSNIDNRYAAMLWQYRISAEVLSADWMDRTGPRDRYIVGDQYVNDLIENSQADPDELQNMTTEHHNITAVSEIQDLAATCRSSGAFDTLDYPLTYEDALYGIKKAAD